MDKTVPAGAAILLDFIRKTEVGRDDRASYDVIYGHKQSTLAKPLTSMTYGDIVDAQKLWTRLHGSSAAGGYQFMRATLIDLGKEIPGISGSQVFDDDFQDRLGFHLLKRRGYEAYMSGKMSRTEFGRQLAQEWASFPVLAETKGAHRRVPRGSSYYMGDKLNKALVKPESVEAILDRVKTANAAPRAVPVAAPVVAPEAVIVETRVPVLADPGELQKPAGKSKTVWTWAFAGVGAIVTGAGEFLGGLDWRVQLFISAVTVGFAIYGIKRRADLARAVRDLRDELA